MCSRRWRIAGICLVILGVLALCQAVFHLTRLPAGRYAFPDPIPLDHPYFAHLRWFGAMWLAAAVVLAGCVVLEVSPRGSATGRIVIGGDGRLRSATLLPPASRIRQTRWHRLGVGAVRFGALGVGLVALVLIGGLLLDPEAQVGEVVRTAILAIVIVLLILGGWLRRARPGRISVSSAGPIVIDLGDPDDQRP